MARSFAELQACRLPCLPHSKFLCRLLDSQRLSWLSFCHGLGRPRTQSAAVARDDVVIAHSCAQLDTQRSRLLEEKGHAEAANHGNK